MVPGVAPPVVGGAAGSLLAVPAAGAAAGGDDDALPLALADGPPERDVYDRGAQT